MPTYDYQCTKCNHIFEAFQKINDLPLEACPKCKGKLRRLIGSGAGIIFKGPGFYATDYRKGAKPSGSGGCSAGCNSCPHHK